MSRFVLFILILFAKNLAAQKVVDKVIDNEEKRKVEKARKLYNQLKIFEGEKILKDLVKEHPNDVYFHEALVQMQRQVLYRIRNAGGELKEFYRTNSTTDTADLDMEDEPAVSGQPNEEPVSTREIYESLGLDMSRINVKDERNGKEKSKAEYKFEADPEEAVVTIDSTILFSEEERAEFAKNKPRSPKMDKEVQKKLKALSSFAEIPYDAYLYDMIRNARNATRLFPNADSSSLYLREFLIDTVDVNAEVKPEAMSTYRDALEEYYDNSVPSAAKLLEKALGQDEVFYSAYLKLGDANYKMGRDTAAIRNYKLASAVNDRRAEPYEKLSIMEFNRGRYTDAAASMISAIMKYPLQHYFSLLKRVVEKTGHSYKDQWIRRDVYPLSPQHMYEEIMADDKSPWWHYQAAKQEVYGYFDTSGVVRPNEKTRERYLEVYAWRKMLKETKPEYFTFARAMEKVGYLDCYTLISLYHVDLYPQYLDLVETEPEKVKNYFYMLINWEEPRYDKLRKSVQVVKKEEEKKVKK